ncbi:MAG: hypothetical protein A3K90_04130 [Pelodictyon luteolum]|uniref:HTH luxR-type domain-containing protein n=1 Tax=Pelodictyon luteolum TaxID=1100 RepID=A0A165MGE6_PELLU|nr:response regulator receiver protein [Pelodictyon luteolum]KZK75217.1 MAG: hypothetical protein A3K90_04130 [Pelodictyon luteolum]
MSTRAELEQVHAGLKKDSAEKAEEIERATQNPGGARAELTQLLDAIYGADIPTDLKRPMTDLLVRLSEHEQLEERFGTLLTNADTAFLKQLQATHPNLTPREATVCLFVKLGYDTREIARRRGITTRGMESIRYRLHKKIGRGKHQALKTYLSGL